MATGQTGECFPLGGKRHQLHVLGSAVFCGVCGAYSFLQTHNLAGPCRGYTKGAVAGRLRKMLSGCHPTSGLFLGRPRPLWDLSMEFHVQFCNAGPNGDGDAEGIAP